MITKYYSLYTELHITLFSSLEGVEVKPQN